MGKSSSRVAENEGFNLRNLTEHLVSDWCATRKVLYKELSSDSWEQVETMIVQIIREVVLSNPEKAQKEPLSKKTSIKLGLSSGDVNAIQKDKKCAC